MVPSILSAAFAALTVTTSTAFTLTHQSASRTSGLHMAADDGVDTRRGFMDRVASVGISIAGASSILAVPQPAMAYGFKKANDRLSSYGLPPLKAGDGFTALAEIYGKGRNRSPLLVSFGFPLDWVVTLPSQDVNGEDGTIQAGEYAKGDTATFFVVPDQGKVENINEMDKSFFESILIKAISQKGNNMYQDFKITKVVPSEGEVKGQKYALIDYKYTLLTGAGFEVERKGVASVTSVGDGVQLLWSASIAARYKNKTEKSLRSIVESFRCYADGLNFSDQLRRDEFEPL